MKIQGKSEPNRSRTKVHHEAENFTFSRPAKQRLKWIQHFYKYRNARLTCRHFGISPDTFYLWKKRYDSGNLMSLEDNKKNRKPHKVRFSKHAKAQAETVRKLKNMDPRLGKIRIAKILKEMNYKISPSSVTRILRLTIHAKET